MNTRIQLKPQGTGTLDFYTLWVWSEQMIRQFSDTSEDPENDTVIEHYSDKALYSSVKGLLHAIWNEDNGAQIYVAYRILHNAKHCIMGRRLD